LADLTTITRASGISNAPPIPCIALDATRAGSVRESPHNRDPTRKQQSAAANMFLVPKRFPSALPTGMNIVMAT
jgi:hypothetical protein